MGTIKKHVKLAWHAAVYEFDDLATWRLALIHAFYLLLAITFPLTQIIIAPVLLSGGQWGMAFIGLCVIVWSIYRAFRPGKSLQRETWTLLFLVTSMALVTLSSEGLTYAHAMWFGQVAVIAALLAAGPGSWLAREVVNSPLLAGAMGAVAWDRISDYLAFDSIEQYQAGVRRSREHDSDESEPT